jgi:hypothetical protein
MSGPTASNPLDVCGAVVASCMGNALKRQQHLPQQEIQKTGLSVQAIVVQQVITELSDTVSEKDKIMIITKWYLT